ncbi:MAG: hypothetical protein BWX88_03091 [Planctomycetes bacterium ADurb.Bin126]|nr:MAG: hypothetical protein BWX88_03091 [Planctomycetes bacterium ADurb.Bin126]HOD84059.1 hypothetical protein [Phycisphaerae bacterium]HQL76413.1 hypothetical protein [Phycisphaerae bacterium]
MRTTRRIHARGAAPTWLLGVLVLVILGALAYTFFTFASPGGSGTAISNQRAQQKVNLKCEKCGHEFSMTLQELAGQSKDRDEPVPVVNGAPKADCPSCKAKWSAVVVKMTRPRGDQMVPGDVTPPRQP